MGNQISTAPSGPIIGVEQHLNELPEFHYIQSLLSNRFLKTTKVKLNDQPFVAKVFVKHDSSLSLAKYASQTENIRKRLSRNPNAIPYCKTLETDKAAFLVRQFFYTNLYDRISTRPFLANIEKKWIVFQILRALALCHDCNIYHGDIKTENIAVTTWQWAFLVDFAPFKPTFLPEDNPAAFSFFFDTSGRRTCYIAPERFYTPSTFQGKNFQDVFEESSHVLTEGELTRAMDIFSTGCVIAELFLEGNHLFDLSQLLAYRKGTYDVDAVLARIDDAQVRLLIKHMIQIDPNKRLTAQGYLDEWRGSVFPKQFWMLHDLISDLGLKATPDAKMARLYQGFQSILSNFELSSTGIVSSYGPTLFAKPGTHASPIENRRESVSSPTVEGSAAPSKHPSAATGAKPASEKKPLADDDTDILGLSIEFDEKGSKPSADSYILSLLVSLITSTLRSLVHSSSKLKAIDMLIIMGQSVCDEYRLERILPFFTLLLTDRAPLVRATALRAMTRLLCYVRYVPAAEAAIFPEYILEHVSSFVEDEEVMVRVACAENIALLADTALRFLEMTQVRADSLVYFANAQPPSTPSAALSSGAAGPPPLVAQLSQTSLSSVAGDIALTGASSAVSSSSASTSAATTPSRNRSQSVSTVSSSASLSTMNSFSTLASAATNAGSSQVGGDDRNPGDPNPYQASFDAELKELLSVIRRMLNTIIIDPALLVRRAMLSDIGRLCIVFGRMKDEGFLLTHILTYLNAKDWRLRAAFFDSIVAVASYVGGVGLKDYILPLFSQGFHDEEEYVIERALNALVALAEFKLFHKDTILSQIQEAAPFLLHPNLCIRYSAASFIVCAIKLFSRVEFTCVLLKSLQPYIKVKEIAIPDVPSLLSILHRPIRRAIYEYVTSVPDLAGFFAFLTDCYQKRTSVAAARGQSAESIFSLSELKFHQKDMICSSLAKKYGLYVDEIPKLIILSDLIIHRRRRLMILGMEFKEATDRFLNTTLINSQMESSDDDTSLAIKNEGFVSLEAHNVPVHSFTVSSLDTRAGDYDGSSAASGPTSPRGKPTGDVSGVSLGASTGLNGSTPSAAANPMNEEWKLLFGRTAAPAPSSSKQTEQQQQQQQQQALQRAMSPPPPYSVEGGNVPGVFGSPPGPGYMDVALSNPQPSGAPAPANPGGRPMSIITSKSAAGASFSSSLQPQPPNYALVMTLDGGMSTPGDRSSKMIGNASLQAAGGSLDSNESLHSDVWRLKEQKKLELYPTWKQDLGEATPLPTRTAAVAFNKPRSQTTASAGSSGAGASAAGTVMNNPAVDNWRPQDILVAHFHEHQKAVNRIVVSPDHSYFASCSDDGTVKIWDCQRLEKYVTNRSRRTYTIQGGKIKAIACCENSHSIASASDNGTIHVMRIDYKPSSGTSELAKYGQFNTLYTKTLDLEEEGSVVDLYHFDSDTQSLLTYATTRGNICGWDLRSDKRNVFNLKNPRNHGLITSYIVDPARNWLLAGTARGFFDLWDIRFLLPASNWRHKACKPIIRLANYPSEATSGKSPWILASTAGSNGEFAAWDVESKTCKQIFSMSATVGINSGSANTKNAQSTTMTVGNKERDSLADQDPINDLHTQMTSPFTENTMALLVPQGRPFVISGGTDRRLRLWDLRSMNSSYCITAIDEVVTGSVNAGGTNGAAGGTGNTNNPAFYKPQYQSYLVDEQITVVQELPSNERHSPASRTFNGVEVRGPAPPSANHHDGITDLAFSEVPRPVLISGSRDGVIKVWK